MTTTDPLEAFTVRDALQLVDFVLLHAELFHECKHTDELRAEIAASPRPAGVDARVVEAFDLLGGMWSWHEEPDLNDYLHGGGTWWHQAGRLLREVVGRPAQPPASVTGSEEPARE